MWRLYNTTLNISASTQKRKALWRNGMPERSRISSDIISTSQYAFRLIFRVKFHFRYSLKANTTKTRPQNAQILQEDTGIARYWLQLRMMQTVCETCSVKWTKINRKVYKFQSLLFSEGKMVVKFVYYNGDVNSKKVCFGRTTTFSPGIWTYCWESGDSRNLSGNHK